MPLPAQLCDGLIDAQYAWPEYAVKDGEILQEIVREHTERDTADYNLNTRTRAETTDDGALINTVKDLTFSFPDEAGPWNRYKITSDGKIFSGHAVNEDPRCERRRHETITEHRLNALVGRANKTVELIEYIESFEPYDLDDLVFRRYCEEPVRSPTDLEETIAREHGAHTVNNLRGKNPALLNRAGAAHINTDEQYEQIVTAVTRDNAYTAAMPEAVKIDHELCTKGRDMLDWYDGKNRTNRKDMRGIHKTIMGLAAERLEKEDIYDEVMAENRHVYGDWPVH